MNDRSAKVAVVVIGALVTIGAIVWRSADALKKETGGLAPAEGWSMDVVSENRASERVRDLHYIGLDSVQGLAAEPLGVVEFRGTRASIDRSVNEHSDFLPIRQKQIELGANVTLKESIDDTPDMPGQAKMRVSLWLVHTGPFPASLLKAKQQPLCVITDVDPTGDAFAGGLRPGDVWTGFEGIDTLSSASPRPCAELSSASRASDVGSTLRFVVYRQGQKQDLTLHKKSPQMKFMSFAFPVLDADRI